MAGSASVSTVNSATRGVPNWLKTVFADDLEDKGGPHQFGVGKPHSLADLFEPAEGEDYSDYAGYEGKIINLHGYWKTYTKDQYKKKVLKKFNITPYKDRRVTSSTSKASRKPQDVNIVDSLAEELASNLSLDWSVSADETDEAGDIATPIVSAKKLSRSARSSGKKSAPSTPQRILFPPSKSNSPRTMSGTVRSDIVVDSDGTVVGKSLLHCSLLAGGAFDDLYSMN